jgi:hypothetical protein
MEIIGSVTKQELKNLLIFINKNMGKSHQFLESIPDTNEIELNSEVELIPEVIEPLQIIEEEIVEPPQPIDIPEPIIEFPVVNEPEPEKIVVKNSVKIIDSIW